MARGSTQATGAATQAQTNSGAQLGAANNISSLLVPTLENQIANPQGINPTDLAALRTSPILVLVFVTLSITFVLLTVGAFSGNSTISQAGGWFGLLTAFEAWYASAAGVTASTFKRSILPTGSR